MRLTLIAIFALLFLFGGVGCGPIGPMPIPDRLSDDDQKKMTESWEKALQPADRLDRQAILDALICTQAYQMGVDRLHFRSEVVACW